MRKIFAQLSKRDQAGLIERLMVLGFGVAMAFVAGVVLIDAFAAFHDSFTTLNAALK